MTWTRESPHLYRSQAGSIGWEPTARFWWFAPAYRSIRLGPFATRDAAMTAAEMGTEAGIMMMDHNAYLRALQSISPAERRRLLEGTWCTGPKTEEDQMMPDEQNSLTAQELYRLRDARSEAEWNAICDEVKRTRGGDYPADWYAKIILSGLARETAARWRRGSS